MTIFALDLGGTEIKSALISETFEVKKHFAVQPSPDNLQDLEELIDRLLIPVKDQLSGLAISCPGTVDTHKGTIYKGGLLTYLDGFEAKSFFEARYHCPVALLNDGKSAVLAELATGNLKGIDNGFALVLGSGLGGGIIINGQLYQGSNFQAGELTFMVTPQAAPLQKADMAGSSVSAVEMIERCALALQLADKKDGRAVFEYIRLKDQRVYPIFQAYCRQIAIHINNVQAVLDAQRVVIGGGISQQPILIEEISRQLDQLEMEDGFVFRVVNRPELFSCRHKNDANLIGAAYFFASSI
ncbi:ROK family protein [Streptococcus dentiloxodontae]